MKNTTKRILAGAGFAIGTSLMLAGCPNEPKPQPKPEPPVPPVPPIVIPDPECECPNGTDHWEGDDCCLNNDGSKTKDCDCKTVAKASGEHVAGTQRYDGEDGDCYVMFNGQLVKRKGDNCESIGPRPLPCPCPPNTQHEWNENCGTGCVGIGNEGCGCVIKPEPVVEQDPVTLENLFNEGYTATIKGTLTNTQWADVAGKVENALNGAFTAATNPVKTRFRNVFMVPNNTVIIIVEKMTENDRTYKVDGTKFDDVIILRLNFDALDNNDLQSKITSAVRAMNGDDGFPLIGRAVNKGNMRIASVGASQQHLKQTTNPKKIRVRERRAQREYLATVNARNVITRGIIQQQNGIMI